MLGELVGLQVGNLQGLEAELFACWPNLWGCRSVGCQPKGFGGYIISMLGELVGL